MKMGLKTRAFLCEHGEIIFFKLTYFSKIQDNRKVKGDRQHINKN